MLDTLRSFALAMYTVGLIAKWRGRRLLRAELESRYNWLDWNADSPMLRVQMAPRRLRRQLQGKNFRPVYGYVGGGL